MTAVPKPGARKKAPPNRVDPDVHLTVRLRDRLCFGVLAHNAQTLGDRWVAGIEPIPWHQCRTQWGREHSAASLDDLTVDHFHRHAGGTMRKKAKSDKYHLVAMCGWMNNLPPSAAVREAERAWVTHLYGPDGP